MLIEHPGLQNLSAMFRKPKRNFRQRVVNSDSDDEFKEQNEDSNDAESSRDSLNSVDKSDKKSKDKKKKEKSKTVLSFDHEEGDTLFQVKKSSHSKKVAKELKKKSQREKEVEVKQEKEEEKIIPVESVKKEPGEEYENRIKKLREEFLTMNGEEAAALEGGEGSDEEDTTFKKMLRRGEIPDATTIHQIRKQRQLARDMGDFLPLDDTVKYENSSSRLIREDDNDKSDDEDERIEFSTNKEAIERQRMKDNFLAAEHGSGDEGSDQEREWEEQQILKGVTGIQQVPSNQDLYSLDQGQQGNQSNDSYYSNGYHGNQTDKQPQGASFQPQGPSFQPFESMSKMTKESKDINMELLVKRLKERLTSMDEVHRSHVTEKDTLVNDISNTEQSIVDCENSIEGLEGRYRFFQEMRGYVRDLVECLNEKVPVINDLEARMTNLYKNRAAKFTARRQQDTQDQCQAYMTNKSQQVVLEPGADQVRQRRVAEREARRARRRRARENKNIIGHHDGVSSDDEENQSEIMKFNQERDEVSEVATDLFEDVVDDFSDTDSVREKFYDWKNKYGDTYKEAYIGLCLPKLVNPFVRLQLINWNPLQENCKDFEELRWYESLLFYGFKEGEAIDREDEDVKLLPAIVDKIILPKLSLLAEQVWDPLSTAETCRFVNLMQKLQRDYPSINGAAKNTQTLLKCIVSRMKRTLDDDVFVPLYPKNVLENRNTGPSVFFHRQSWTCIKLLGNFLSWHGIISTKVLQGLSLDGLLNRYILLGLQTAPFNQETMQKCQAIVSTFPKQWFSELEDEKTIPQLENLCRFLNYATQLLDKACQTARDIDKKEYRDQMKQISKIFVNINAMEHAINMSSIYNLNK